MTRKCADGWVPAAQRSVGAAAKPSPGQEQLHMITTGKAPVLQSRCIIYDLMIAH